MTLRDSFRFVAYWDTEVKKLYSQSARVAA